jgi:membrane associated rhomboid family serine protease
MPQCLKCGAELPINEEGLAPVLCDRCAGRATRRARIGMSTSTFTQFPATTALVAINVAVFIGMVLSGGGSITDFSPEQTILWGANYTPLTVSGQYWRLVTAGFVHGGLYHILFNMWALWSLGQLSERLFGRWITVAVYLLTGVGGSLLSLVARPVTFEVGASGAIFGIAGAILSGMKFGNVSIPSFQRRAIFSSLVFFVGFNLAIGFGLVSLGIGIDNMCHLGGLITGLIFGVPLATASASGKKSFEWATILVASLALAGIGAQAVQSKSYVSQLTVAKQKLDAGDYQGAIALLQRTTAVHPQNADAHVLLGMAYERNGEREKALASYQRALQLEPGFSQLQKHVEQMQSPQPAEK